jgi:hypothetical protein
LSSVHRKVDPGSVEWKRKTKIGGSRFSTRSEMLVSGGAVSADGGAGGCALDTGREGSGGRLAEIRKLKFAIDGSPVARSGVP